VSPASWSTLLLVWAAFTLYPASWFALSLARARRGARFRRPLAIWLLAAAVPSVTLLAARPWLLWVGVGYAVLFAVNLAFARRNQERDLVNDVVLAGQATGLVPLVHALAAPGAPVPERVWLLTAGCALVLVGSTLHVKSLLRERSNPAYAVASRCFAVASLLVAGGLAWGWGMPGGLGLVVPFVALTARAFRKEWLGWRPARIGLLELAACVLVALGTAFAVLA
jgi:hypothetical protein